MGLSNEGHPTNELFRGGCGCGNACHEAETVVILCRGKTKISVQPDLFTTLLSHFRTPLSASTPDLSGITESYVTVGGFSAMLEPQSFGLQGVSERRSLDSRGTLEETVAVPHRWIIRGLQQK